MEKKRRKKSHTQEKSLRCPIPLFGLRIKNERPEESKKKKKKEKRKKKELREVKSGLWKGGFMKRAGCFSLIKRRIEDVIVGARAILTITILLNEKEE